MEDLSLYKNYRKVCLSIEGGIELNGEVSISGSKNAALPILAASLLFKKPVKISNIPNIIDINIMLRIIRKAGADVKRDDLNSVTINAKNLNNPNVDLLASQSRSSILTAGAILKRYGKVNIPMPGGCKIGKRLIDFHISAFKKMGAKVYSKENSIDIIANKDLKNIDFTLPSPSVGATEQIIITSVLNEGVTIIRNAALEPEIKQLCEFLISCGAKIDGAGTRTIKITGVYKLKPKDYTILGDRIEAGTYAMAIIATNGIGELKNIKKDQIPDLLDFFFHIGVKFSETSDGIKIFGNTEIYPADLRTSPYPGFHTDLQAPATALFAGLDNKAKYTIVESIYDQRFNHVPELIKMGADIEIDNDKIIINSNREMEGATVYGHDLRAAKSLVIAGLSATGNTKIFGLDQLYRGYEKLVSKLEMLGAKIKETVEE